MPSRIDMAHGVQNLGAPTVVECYVERNPVVVLGHLQCPHDLLLQMRVDALHAPAVQDFDAILVELVELALNGQSQAGALAR